MQQFRSAPVAAVIEPVQDLEIGGQQGVAPSKRFDHCFLGIVRSDPHGSQNSPLWLIRCCERGCEVPALAAFTDWRQGGSCFQPFSLFWTLVGFCRPISIGGHPEERACPILLFRRCAADESLKNPARKTYPIADRGRTRRESFATSVKARERGSSKIWRQNTDERGRIPDRPARLAEVVIAQALRAQPAFSDHIPPRGGCVSGYP